MIAGGDISIKSNYLASSRALAEGFANGALAGDQAALQTVMALEAGLETEKGNHNIALLVFVSAYKKALILGKSEELEALGPAIAEVIREQSQKLDRILTLRFGSMRFAPRGEVSAKISRVLTAARPGARAEVSIYVDGSVVKRTRLPPKLSLASGNGSTTEEPPDVDYMMELFRGEGTRPENFAYSFNKLLPDLVRRGLFQRRHYFILIQCLKHSNPEICMEAVNVFQKHLPLFLEKGWFFKTHLDAIVRNLKHPDHGVRNFSLGLLATHFSRLVQAGLFQERHYVVVAGKLAFLNTGGTLHVAIEFFRKNLPQLVERGWVKEREVARLSWVLLMHDPNDRDAARELFKAHLPLLVERGLFTRSHSQRLIQNTTAGSPQELYDIVAAFQPHFHLLIEKGLFLKEDLDFLFSTLRSADPRSEAQFCAAYFIREFFEHFLKAGWFKQEYHDILINSLIYRGSAVRNQTRTLFEKHLPELLRLGFFKEKEYQALERELIDTSFRDEIVQLFVERLPLFIEKGWFEKTSYDHLVLQLKDAARHGYWPTVLNFFDKHLPLLIPRGWLEKGLLARAVLGKPDILFKHFHLLKASGALDKEFFDLVLEAAQLSEESKEVLKPLALSEDWLVSPLRWKALLSLVKEDDKRKTVDTILTHLYQASTPFSAEELARFISVMNFAEVAELKPLVVKGSESDPEYARRLLPVFQATAEKLGATQHPDYQALLARLETKEGIYLLADWYLTGLETVWIGYQKAEGEEEIKRKRKLFLNFARQNITRPIPSLARLYTKWLEKIISDQFVTRLSAEASAEESGRLDLFKKGPVFNRLLRSPLYPLLVKASRFMNPQGLKSLRRFVLGLQLEEGRLVYPRYEELEGAVGKNFLEAWKKGYAKEMKGTAPLDIQKGKEALKTQVLAQVKGHLVLKEGVAENEIPLPIRDLPAKVREWRDRFEEAQTVDGEFVQTADALRTVFETHYNAIRAHFGDVFANIRTDLRNYTVGMDRGVKTAKWSERFVVSGDVETLARSGSEPVHTCQTLEFNWVNANGEPIHRLIHGQFKVANWEIDGIVMARRLLEVTLDQEGDEHLLAEQLYNAGGFARITEFREEILKYAAFLGIQKSHVHFNDEKSFKNAPAPLKPGDPIYRDSYSNAEGMELEAARALQKRKRGKGK